MFPRCPWPRCLQSQLECSEKLPSSPWPGRLGPGPVAIFGPSFYHTLPPVESARLNPCSLQPSLPEAASAWKVLGRFPIHAMAARTVPHAYPMSSEYEFANPSKIYDQNFGEGKKGDEILPGPCSPLGQEGW